MTFFRGKKMSDPESAPAEKAAGGFSLKSFIKGAVVATLAIAAALLAYVFISVGKPSKRPDSIQSLAKITWVENTIRSAYMGEIDEAAQVDNMLYALVASLGDPYSTYYTEEEYREISSQHKGETKGIGVVLMQDAESGELLITEVLEGTPAEKAGIQAGDIVLSVNGQDARKKTSSEAADMITAVGDEPVVLRVLRGKEELEFEMEKTEIEIRSVAGRMLEDKIGYIRISSFNDLTPVQFRNYYEELNDGGMKGLIIDLRENRGGLVDACCDTLAQFLTEGVIVYEEDKHGKTVTRDCEGKTPIEIPLVLLVNRHTASSSEIFTGAVQDHGVGTVMGEKTLGKGIEQNYYQLPDNGVIKLTTIHYFTPNHRDIHETGLEPDVDLSGVELSEKADTWLEEAVKYIKELF